jgi:hypothetical protein
MTNAKFALSRRAAIQGIVSTSGLLLAGCSEQIPTKGHILRV